MESKVENTLGEIKDHLCVNTQRSSGGVQEEAGNCDPMLRAVNAVGG